MAEKQEKLKKTKKRGAANSTRAGNSGKKPSTRTKKARAEKSSLDKVYEALDLSGPEDQDVDGEEMLRTSMNRLAAKRSAEIAKKLGQKAEEGNITSAKLILQIVGKKKQSKELLSNGLINYVGTLECDSELVKTDSKEAVQTKDAIA